MTELRRSKRSLLLELSGDCLLLLFWIPQFLLLCCLLIYGHVPIPAEWLNTKLRERPIGDIVFQAKQYKLKLNGSFEVVGLQVYDEDIEKPIIEAESALARYDVSLGDGFIKVDELVIGEGTLHMPAVYAPDGTRTVLLDRIAVDLKLQNDELEIRSVCARHEDISIRGAFTMPLDAFSSDAPASDAVKTEVDPLRGFYNAVARGLEIRQKYHFFTEPTLSFDVQASSLEDFSIRAILSSPALQYETNRLENISVALAARYAAGKLSFSAPTVIETELLKVPDYDILASDVSCQITQDDWDEILALEWPSIELSAQRLDTHDVQVDAPFFQLWKDAPSVVGFKGSAEGLKGFVNFEGAFDVLDRDGWIDVDGNLDLYDVVPEATKEHLPEMVFEEPPHYNVDLSFAPGPRLERAYFDVSIPNVSVDGIQFDHILGRGKYVDDVAEISNLVVYREQQEAHARMRHNRTTGDFDIVAKGKFNPQDYNSLLPSWWANIFEDFTITDESDVKGDFLIQSNLKENRVKYFYGSVDIENILYSKVPIKTGHVIARGTGRYIEVHIIHAQGSEGKLDGAIGFAVLPDDKPSPVSLHLDVQLQLSQEATKNLLGEVTYDRIVGDFSFESIPFATVEGVSFYDDYPEFAGKSHYRFSINSQGPVIYDSIPLGQLSAVGYADDSITQLRHVNFGYAKGQGSAELDIFDYDDRSNIINLRAEIRDADEELAIANLPALEDLEDDLKNNDTAPEEGNGRLSATVRAMGPIEDPYEAEGFGNFTIQDREIGTIRMLGPLSRVVGFTAFELDTLTGAFVLRERKAFFPDLRVDGPRTQINASGSMTLEEQELDMRVAVRLFGNSTTERNPINRITSIINPLAMLLRFNVTGTLDAQKIRSTYDPRNLLPGSGRSSK